jgi:hypothetical protein
MPYLNLMFEICGGEIGTGVDFLRAIQFPQRNNTHIIC